ncbi:hypothetical protein GGR56DRAFT_667600 [Xylariaceae sp. FL0804]|nr:hypothetical protein GGR56DRAFT_667600 [Xylariaceae sp. FL0804]
MSRTLHLLSRRGRFPLPCWHLILRHEQKGSPVKVHKSWLRDACTCSECVDPSSGQKTFSTADIPAKLQIRKACWAEDGSLEVEWDSDFRTGDIHVSRYPPSDFKPFELSLAPQGRPWRRADIEARQPFFSYDEFMARDDSFASAMRELHWSGLIFLRGVPLEEQAVESIAEKVGGLQETFYGKTWDVVSKPDAENVAYTNSYLGLHQDLLYMQNPPRIQLLHCLKNSCDGGDSFFSDGFRAAMELESSMPISFASLSRRDVTFHYQKGEHSFAKQHPILKARRKGKPSFAKQHLILKARTHEVDLIHWSPPFQRPQQPLTGHRDYEIWLRGIKAFKSILEHPDAVFEYRMQPGDCVLFDNLRVLHGRRHFDTSAGERWLKGAYVDTDSYLSALLPTLRLELIAW